MKHGVIVGLLAEASAQRLVLADGTEFDVSGLLAFPRLASGMTVKIVYQVANGLKIPLSITVLPDRR